MQIEYKKKPVNKKKLMQTVMSGALAGLAFSIVVLLFVFFIGDSLKEHLGLKTEDQVVIQMDGSDDEERKGGTDTEDQAFFDELYNTGEQASKFLVGVNLNAVEGYEGGTTDYNCGIIMGNTDQNIIVLATPDAVKNEETANITFCGGQTVIGTVLGVDKETGISVIRVPVANLNEQTRRSITVAKMGDSGKLSPGAYTVAIGNPLGSYKSLNAGQFTSVSSTTQCMDREYTLLETSMLGRRKTRGFLLDTKGKVVGLITHNEDVSGENLTIKAYGISDLSSLIEVLCNNEKIPYVGVKIHTIDDETANIYNVSKGIYVDYVNYNSPAMAVGIQKGDIIKSVNDVSTLTAKSFSEEVLKAKVGDSITIHILRPNDKKYKSVSVCVELRER